MYLITGANGFIGGALTRVLLEKGQSVVAAVRKLPVPAELFHANLNWIATGDINSQTQWKNALVGVHTVVHCAARAHVAREQVSDILMAYREVNVKGTVHLAKEAAVAGVRRFVFISSIGVNGKQSVVPFSEDFDPKPEDAYAVSKFEAEQALLDLSFETGMEVVIIRPPLVYGKNAPGSFASLVCWVRSGLPLPLGAVYNLRSLVALDNLVSLVLLCCTLPQAANNIFVVADGEDVSTTTLLRKVAQAAGKPSRLLPVPAWLIRAGATLLGKRAFVEQLLGNLQVDPSKANSLLGWRPVVTMDEQLNMMFAMQSSRPLTSYFYYQSLVMRVLDFLLAVTGLLMLWPLLLLVAILCWCDTRSPLFMQTRLGRDQRPFVLYKFRTMPPNTASMSSHLVDSSAITPLGAFLRRTKLDELPQLWNVVKGEMSLVGPRPCLLTQTELIHQREARNVFAARPGITGLAQVNNIDMSTPKLLADTDARMLTQMTVVNYFKYILKTMAGQKVDAVKPKNDESKTDSKKW